MSGKQFYVYILAHSRDGAIYTGVTSDLVARVYLHRSEIIAGHTSRYHIHKLVYFEVFSDPEQAILREKRVKSWVRAWRVALIEKENPEWRDLYPEIAGL